MALQSTISWRFIIPQKLSKSTLSLPCSHLIFTRTSLSSLGCKLILTPKAGSSSVSSSSSCHVEAKPSCLWFFFRLAALDQTFSLARPIPVAKFDRYCHRIFNCCITAFTFCEQSPIVDSGTRMSYSGGKGKRFLGSVLVARATAYNYDQWVLLTCNDGRSYFARPETAPTPRNCPPLCLVTLYQIFDCPILNACILDFFQDCFNAACFSQHTCVPLASFPPFFAFIYYSADESYFAAWCNHFNFGACACGIRRTRFRGC